MNNELRAEIETSYAELSAVLAAISPEAAQRPGIAGEWNAGDLVAHLIRWQEEALGHLEALRDGTYERRQYDFDAFNAVAVEERRGVAWPKLVEQLAGSHAAMVALSETLPEEMWEDKRVSGWLKATVHGHYAEHIEQLRVAAEGAGQ